MAECEGKDCFLITHKTSDPVAETFRVNRPEENTYDMPTPDSGRYNFAFYPQMREAFARKAAEEMAKYTPSQSCNKGCTCSPSTDPDDAKHYDVRIKVVAEYPFPDGSGTTTVTGSFRLETTRTEGICVAGEGVYRVVGEEKVGLSTPNLEEVLAGKKRKQEQKQKQKRKRG